MELDLKKKSRRDRMMRSKSFDTQEVREIGRKEAGESRSFPTLFMRIIEDERWLVVSIFKYVTFRSKTLTWVTRIKEFDVELTPQDGWGSEPTTYSTFQVFQKLLEGFLAMILAELIAVSVDRNFQGSTIKIVLCFFIIAY